MNQTASSTVGISINKTARGSKLNAFQFELFKKFGARLKGERVLIACSGGLDSIALVHALHGIAKKSGFTCAVAYVDHGPSKTASLLQYRREAQGLVRDFSESLGLDFFSLETSRQKELSSEAELREARLSLLKSLKVERKFSRIAYGHHADDLLETRLMRLIRGSGLEGVRAMREMTSLSLRPFLSIERSAIEAYANDQKLRWCEDPSNLDQKYFRNWVRHEWLRALESKSPGAKRRLAQSLQLIADQVADRRSETKPEPVMTRDSFAQLGKMERRAWIASQMRTSGVMDFSTRHIEEIEKRILSLAIRGQRHGSFSVGGATWDVSKFVISGRRTP